MRPTRRSLLRGAAAAGAAGLVGARPRLARAAGPSDRNFLFLTCFGGWDATRSLIPAFDSDLVSMEPQARPREITADLTVVEHPMRPSQTRFWDRWGDQVAVVHGLLVPSVAHMACLQLARTGALSGSPDWPAIIAAANGGSTPLPHLAISGPSYPAELAPFSARTGAGGQLAALVSGDVLSASDLPVQAPPAELAALQAQLVADRRAATLARGLGRRHAALLEGHAVAGDRVGALRAAAGDVSWQSTGAFPDDCLLAVELLGAGLSRCISLAHPALWDSHSENELYQQLLWEETFLGLELLADALASTPGAQGGSLADETVVVVMSEMGRSPSLNENNGKDHWPYASAMLWGPGVSGGRAYGGYDEAFRGAGMNLASGAVDPAASPVACGGFGATLLALADIDPAEWVPGEDPITAMIEP